MTLDEIMDRASITPNADIDCFLAGDAIGAQKIAVSLDSQKAVKLIDSNLGLAPIGSGGSLYLGQAQNAPSIGGASVVRIAGITRCVYGGTVSVGDRLKLAVSTGRVVRFDTANQDGHVHSEAVAIIRRVVYVVSSIGIPVTGVAANLTTTLQLDNGGSFNTASETVTVTEIASGEYLVSYTPNNVATNYRLRVVSTHGHIVTPPEFQDTSTARLGAPSASTLMLIVGTALTAGVNGDEGHMLISRQIF